MSRFIIPDARNEKTMMRSDARDDEENHATGARGRVDADHMMRSDARDDEVDYSTGVRGRVDPDQIIAALASLQHGVVTRKQLLEAGVTLQCIRRRVRKRRLIPLHRGVYRVGPFAAAREKEMAAALACGRTAVVSLESAGGAWGVRPVPSTRAPVDIFVRSSAVRRRAGIRVRRVSSLVNSEVTTLERIPITTPARTLYDLAAACDTRSLEAAVAEAFARRLTNAKELERLLERHRGRPGEKHLSAILGAGPPAHTLSTPEQDFLALIRKSPLPQPEVNVKVAGFPVDFFFRKERLVVEVDGFAFHSSPKVFAQDRRKDQVLMAAGNRVVRFPATQVTEEPQTVLIRVAQALVLAAVGSRPG